MTALRRLSQTLGPIVLTALAYGLAGRLALMLALPPAYAAPLFPSAGIALAAVLVYGPRVLPGVVAGALLVNTPLGGDRGQQLWAAWLAASTIGLGAALQALIGAWLVRRRVKLPMVFGEPREVAALFVLGGLLACLTNATIATAVLNYTGVLAASDRLFTAWTWWTGDALGVMIGAPMALSLIGRPRDAWQPRRTTLTLPLLAVTALLGLASTLVVGWDQQRAHHTFDREAQALVNRLHGALREPLHALEAVRGVFAASEAVSPDEMHEATAAWLSQPDQGLMALGHSVIVPKDRVTMFEQAVRASGLPNYRVFARPEGVAATQDDPYVLALRYIEPRAGNDAALGVNTLSIPASREAVQQALRSGLPQASAGFRLTQAATDTTGVVVYRALWNGTTLPPLEQRQARFAGVVFATLRPDQMLASVMANAPSYLGWCFVDTDPRASRTRLAGPAGCERRTSGRDEVTRNTDIDFAGRRWSLRLWAPQRALPEARSWNAWLFSVAGLAAAAMLGAMQLTVTGRARRIETAVRERTQELHQEVQERQRTERALRESEQRLRNILDHVPMGVVYASLAGTIRESNPSFHQLVGYSAEDLANHTLDDLTHPDDRADSQAVIAPLLLGELPVVLSEVRLVRRDGQVVWVRRALSVLRDAEGRPQRLVGVMEDITERLRLRDAERARDSAEAASHAKSEFVSRMSHELRTPLNAMLGFAQLLELDRRPALSPHQHEWTAQIQQAGWHLLHMINDTLDLSRIESGHIRLDISNVDLGTLVHGTVSMMEPGAAKRGIQIEQALQPQAMAVRGDPTRVKQIVTNLLSNAVKYNVDNGRVRISSRPEGREHIALTVHDTGLGMDEAQMQALFQPFNRLGREHTSTEGTGIGLVISRRLAELMGGRLEASSEPGSGSSFVLTLPRANPAEPDTEPAGLHDGLTETYRRRRVHYIEDNETNAEVMRGILARRPQVDLEVSTTGLDGLAALRQQPPSLILLDMHLPDIDGLELLRHLKADSSLAAIPVIAVSADATAARIEQAYADGASEYVTKPVNIAGFLAVIDRMLADQDTLFG